MRLKNEEEHKRVKQKVVSLRSVYNLSTQKLT